MENYALVAYHCVLVFHLCLMNYDLHCGLTVSYFTMCGTSTLQPKVLASISNQYKLRYASWA